MLNIFTRKKNIHTILASFTKCSEELRELAYRRTEEAKAKDAALRSLMSEIEEAEAEAEAAEEAAEAIDNLIGKGHPAFEAAADALA